MELIIRIPDCETGCNHADCAYSAVTGALEDYRDRTRQGWLLIEKGDDREENNAAT